MAYFSRPGNAWVRKPANPPEHLKTVSGKVFEDTTPQGIIGHASSSSASRTSFSGDYSQGFSNGFVAGSSSADSSSVFSFNDKQTMQNLNERLASYLDKVHTLEESNIELEVKILEWYDKQGASASTATQRDHDLFYKAIDELRAKIFEATANKYRSILQVDNIQLAVNDFKRKYEMELDMRQSIEADITGLRRVMDDVTLSRSDLELHIENLKDDLAYLKNNHEEEIRELRTHAAGNVTVEMDAAPGADLTKVLADMREQYEFMADKNRREAEARFIARSEQLQKEVGASVEQVQSRKSEITEIRRSLQGLEIELQTEFSKKKGLEALLSDAECRYAEQLLQMQSKISQYEAQLIDLRANMENQNLEYTMLLDVKNRLEMEINKYRQLLEGQDVKI
ncbi:keratin, type I cytoskeletal 13-like isoform X1 [Pleurodeles waltl]|uniref:keratin, type I cytoskeletal 13-like isoform X1 n=1 Tax=Pleurodeles waltl TaxID=8319 RepID=UPI003709709D